MPAIEDDARSIFLTALESAPEQWPTLIEEACGDNNELRARVNQLLSAHQAIGSIHGGGQVVLDATLGREPISEAPGAVVGPYKLLQQIGTGGMGVVFMAEQTQPMQRTVALKIIKPGMDTRQVIARFEAERQALAMMDHPNIAKVLDAGTTDTGRPYFVMDLVKGVPITTYCDQQHLPVERRLDLFSAVCHAVQHAHQKGIIHRDLKPSNVLVAEYDGKPVPKVIDFGVAKATAQKLTERTMFTEIGQIVGTFEYMSPEQARFNQLDVDTRSDIYSLGVLLYELLAGSTPLEKERLRSAAFDEILRIIGEEEPPRPSTRLSSSDALPSIAANRGLEPKKLSGLVQGELDWIVMKCLDKDRDRRYETASGLATDLQHFLDHEAVTACPPSAMYRLRKFARRNRTAIAVVSLLLLCLVFVIGSAGWAMRDHSLRQSALEQGISSALADAEFWHQRENWPEAMAAAKRAQGLLATGGVAPALKSRVEQWRSDLDTVAKLEKLRLSDALSEGALWRDRPSIDANYCIAFAAIGVDIDTMKTEEAARRIRARPIREQLVAALDGWARLRLFLVGDDSKIAAGRHVEWWQQPIKVASAVDTDEFRNRVRRAVGRDDQAALLEFSQLPEAIRLPASTLELLVHQLRPVEADENTFEVGLLKRAQQVRRDDFYINYWLAIRRPEQSRKNSIRSIDGRFMLEPGNNLLLGDEAIVYAMAAVSLRPRNGYAQSALAAILLRGGQLDEALAAYREALRLEPAEYRLLGAIGIVLSLQGKFDEAIAITRESIELQSDCALSYSNLGVYLRAQGKLDDSIAACHEAIELDPKYADAYRGLGSALSEQGNANEALVAYRKAAELDPSDACNYVNLADELRDLGQYDEAISCCRQAIEREPNGLVAVVAYCVLGSALCQHGRPDEAIVAYRRAIELDPSYADSFDGLGCALHDRGKFDEAVAAHQKAIELNPAEATAYYNLGNVLDDWGRYEDAVAAYRKGIEIQPDDSEAHQYLGVALGNAGKLIESVAAYRRAIELGPKNVDAYVCLGDALQKSGQHDEAIAACRKAIELDAECGPAYVNLGAALEHQGKFDEAIAADRRAIELLPSHYAPYNNLALLLATAPAPHRNPEKAIDLAMRASEFGPMDGTTWSTLGIARYRVGKWQSAIEAFDQSLKLVGTADAGDCCFLAMAHWQLDHKDEARKWYDEAVAWMDKNQSKAKRFHEFRAEAAELLGIPLLKHDFRSHP